MHIYDILMSLIVANLFAAKTENFQFDVIWREKNKFCNLNILIVNCVFVWKWSHLWIWWIQSPI